MKSIKLFFPSRTLLYIIPAIFLSLSSCFTYSSRVPALVENIDIDQTLKVTKDEMQKEDVGQSLGIWVLRDQVVTPQQALTIANLFLSHIDSMKSEFNIWHASWAISNLYRLGNDAVKVELEIAYQKAKKQPERLQGDIKEIANNHINGEEIVTGFIHFGGLFYAYEHLIVPGNNKYIQSYEEYREKQE